MAANFGKEWRNISLLRNSEDSKGCKFSFSKIVNFVSSRAKKLPKAAKSSPQAVV